MKDKEYDEFFDDDTDKTEAGSEKSLLTMIETMGGQKAPVAEVGSRVKGKVLSAGAEFVFVDIGGKNEAMIGIDECKDANGVLKLKPGDTVEAYVVSTANNEVVLSSSLGNRGKAQGMDLKAAMDAGLPVQGKVTGVNKGGFNVSVLGNKGFCPMSQMDTKYFDDPMPYLSKSYTFIISRITEGGRNIVLSRLPILEKEIELKIDKLEADTEAKRVLTGTISRIADFGLFVDLGGIDGLVHISEVSWERTQNLGETFSTGQTVECVVLKVERRRPVRETKISLSIRNVGDDPWSTVSQKLKPGDCVDGRITRLANFGAFVQLIPGIEGLIHISEMRWGQRVNHPSEVVTEGAMVRVNILAVDEQKHTVSCSLRDTADDPWNGIEDRCPAGAAVQGKVSGKAPYGYFIDIADGLTGLLVFSNISADKKANIKIGDTLDVTVESVDTQRRRIGLTCGIKAAHTEERDTREFMAKQKKTESQPSSEFGDMLKAALAGKK
jgi:small subunit ribosomal protein S1